MQIDDANPAHKQLKNENDTKSYKIQNAQFTITINNLLNLFSVQCLSVWDVWNGINYYYYSRDKPKQNTSIG